MSIRISEKGKSKEAFIQLWAVFRNFFISLFELKTKIFNREIEKSKLYTKKNIRPRKKSAIKKNLDGKIYIYNINDERKTRRKYKINMEKSTQKCKCVISVLFCDTHSMFAPLECVA